MVQTGPTGQLAKRLLKSHEKTHSWPKTSVACHVLTPAGKPNPRLAQQIAEEDYEPTELETRIRLNLPPICVKCGQKVKHVRQVPVWLDHAVENLRQLEAKASRPDKIRVYARGGKRAVATSPPHE